MSVQTVLCDGDACHSIELHWDADASLVSVRNMSKRSICVTVRSWLVSMEIHLSPGDSCPIEMSEIEQPVRAEFLR